MITKKAQAEPWMKTILALVLIMIFAILAISYFATSGQNVSEVVNSKILSKVNIALPASPLSKLIPSSVRAAYFNVNISMIQSPPFCRDENIILSAYSSKLPANVTWIDVDCTWDFNTDVDTNGDGDKSSDVDANTCFAEMTAKNIIPTNIKLKIKVARGEHYVNEEGIATATINGTTLYCACDNPHRSCIFRPGLAGKTVLGAYGEDTTMLLNTKNSGGNITCIKGIHITTNLSNQASLQEFQGHLWVSVDGTLSYDNYKWVKSGEKKIIIDNSWFLPNETFIVDGSKYPNTDNGYTLVEQINYELNNCRYYNQNPCPVNLTWYTDWDSTINITDVSIPLEYRDLKYGYNC